MVGINDAISWSKANRVPVIGLGGRTYTLRPTTGSTEQIVMRSYATVICEPGCVIAHQYDSASVSFVGGEAGLTDAAWIGGSFEGITQLADPSGAVFNLAGTRIRLDGITVKNFKDGAAFVLSGDDILLHNLRVDNAMKHADTGGIRFKGGKNFRCENATVDVGGDALLLGPGTASDSISNATCLGLSGSSVTGSVLAVETQYGAIDTVRIDGLRANGGSGGNVVRIRNLGAAALTNVSLRNAVVTCGASTADAVSILNTSTGALGSILLESLTVFVPQPSGTDTTTSVAVRINATGSVAVDGARWSNGGIRPAAGGTATLPSQYLVLRRASNIQLIGLRLDGSTAEQPVVIGDGVVCRSVVLADVAVTRITGQVGTSAPNTVAVLFDRAVNCGYIRGSIAGTDNAYAARFTSFADGCFVEDADLTGISNANGPKVDVQTLHPYRLVYNAGSSQRSQLTLGPQAMVNLTNNWIAPTTSAVVLNPSGSTTLTTIRTATTSPAGQSLPGDLLVLSVVSGSTVTVNDGTGNIQLQTTTGSIVLGGSGQDTLTLMCRGADWVQTGYAKNG